MWARIIIIGWMCAENQASSNELAYMKWSTGNWKENRVVFYSYNNLHTVD